VSEVPGRRRKPAESELFNPEASTPAWRTRLKDTEAGRLVAALHRRRRVPRQLLSAPGGLRHAPLPVPARPRRVRTVVWLPAGPGGMREQLVDTWNSVRASSDDVALIVTDDWTTDCDRESLASLGPDVVVARPRLPSAGPPGLWPVTVLALRTALQQFDFEQFLKIDTDALVTAPHMADRLDELLTDDPTVGVIGTFLERVTGELETDRPYHRRILAGELPHDPQLAEWRRDALARGWPDGGIVQGGCMVFRRSCIDAIVAAGMLDWKPRMRSLVSEDLALTMMAYTCGFHALGAGGPTGAFAIANKHLPISLDDAVAGTQWLIVHSTRVGLDGEPESEIRARAKAAPAGRRR